MRNSKRRIANRRNAQLSTGPVTDAGKARSSQNATLHGLNGNHFSLLKEESAADYIAFRNAQMLELAPGSPIEIHLAGQVVETAWRLQRLHRLEERVYCDAETVLEESAATKYSLPEQRLMILSRYQARLDKLYRQTLKELEERRSLRERDESWGLAMAYPREILIEAFGPALRPLSPTDAGPPLPEPVEDLMANLSDKEREHCEKAAKNFGMPPAFFVKPHRHPRDQRAFLTGCRLLELKARLEKLGVTEPAREFIFINLNGLDPDAV